MTDKWLDRMFRWLSAAAAGLLLLTVFAMLLLMLNASQPAMERFGFGFLIRSGWNPVQDDFGALPFIYGTLVTSALAILLATPIGLGVAVYLSELAPATLRRILSYLVELLAAVPSVIYGLWGLFVLAPFLLHHVQMPLAEVLGWLPLFSGTPIGIGLMAAGVVLAIMILPTIASISTQVLQSVPQVQREAILALGATRWEGIRMVVLPHARSGIVGAVILALGRAVGETMAVTMVIGNAHRIQTSLFGLGNTISSVIANEFNEAVSTLHASALIQLGLVLFAITLLINMFARWLVWRINASPAGRANR